MEPNAPNPLVASSPPPAPQRHGTGGWWAAAISGAVVLVLVGVLVGRNLLPGGNYALAAATATASPLASATSQSIATLQPTATSRPTATAQPTAITRATATSQPTVPPLPTATATPGAQVAYTAIQPGPGCDSGGANWGNHLATISCLPGGVHLAATATQRSGSWYHGVDFYGNKEPFPEDYQLEVSAANITAGTCVGFWYRGPYLAVVCQTGKCYIQRFSGNYPMWSGTVSSAESYSIRLTVIGPSHTLFIDGTQVVSMTDTFSLTTGSNIEVTAFPPSSPGTDDLADFSNFTFTPLQ